ncbi:SgcJ/EcaC family oxidoreductase [Streptomyces triculaminicus]|uniref:SgcJ/EcaC family oxidoreductase n=2 Tax=Streptomyces TaxID=1883 RepID=A0A939FKX2_9ACTN|nr:MULTISPECIES: SgcJ/EcaC family oxidoreductase [Streptomyces]MBO0652609.1 SgcJ/EcaC family oxidoreductase [Streptomyces triculaminicus]QSY51806.1 SgcJ/EcaC family oxidoreductase [Streptomyces griseocarneus]
MTTNGVHPDPELAAAAAVPQRIVEAWAAHDAETFAEVFTEDGTMILPGVYEKGREGIRRFMTAAYQGPFKGTRVTGTPLDLRRLDAGTALLITQGGILADGESEVAEERGVRASWLLVRRDDTWLLAAYQNTPRHEA